MNTNLISISNSHQNIKETNYWETEQAKSGLCFMSGNAGALRLLVPKSAEGYLADMKTGKRVTIEKSLYSPRCIDVVFEDGTDSPFFVALDKSMALGVSKPGTNIPFSVWTEEGLQVKLHANVKRV